MFCLYILPFSVLADQTSENESPQESSTVNKTRESEKNPEDPTKIITKIGIGYNGDLTFNGSLALDDARKVNGSINSDGSEWRLGGSWLFPKGIANFNIDADDYRTSYSLGTFVPLHVLGVDTGKWLLFPMAGFSFTTDKNSTYESYGAYAGMFFLRQLEPQWTVIGWGVGALGTDDYSSIGAGLGLSYRMTKRQSINVIGTASNDIYRSDTTAGINYRFEFN